MTISLNFRDLFGEARRWGGHLQVVQRTPAKRMLAASELPSAKTPCRDILFPAADVGRNGAECGPSWQFIRTKDPARKAYFGPFCGSLGPLSPRQPNHGHFGTDVESSIIQWVGGHPKGSGFGKAPLRRSEPGSNRSVRYVYFKPQTGLTMGTHR
jgi:hypothetical protein